MTQELEQMITALGRLRRRVLVQRNTTSSAQAEDAYGRMLRQVDHAAMLLRQATFAAAEAELALQKHERQRKGLNPYTVALNHAIRNRKPGDPMPE